MKEKNCAYFLSNVIVLNRTLRFFWDLLKNFDLKPNLYRNRPTQRKSLRVIQTPPPKDEPLSLFYDGAMARQFSSTVTYSWSTSRVFSFKSTQCLKSRPP